MSGAVAAIIISGVLVLTCVGIAVGLWIWYKRHKISPTPPFYPLNPINQKIAALKLQKLALPLTPLSNGNVGACLSLTNDPHCPPADPSVLQPVTAPITNPGAWLTQYVMNFPKFVDNVNKTIGVMLYFLPWNPVDVVGNDVGDDAMWLAMLIDGSNSRGNAYRYPIIFDGLNPSIRSDADAVKEYGPGWIQGLGGCLYGTAPYNRSLDPATWTSDALLMGLKIILGQTNPAFAKTNGWVMIGYDDMVWYDNNNQNVVCFYTCSIPGLNNGAGVFYFDQVRESLGLPTSTGNKASFGCRCVCSHDGCKDSCNGKSCQPVN